MKTMLAPLDYLRANPEWISLPIFDRKGWKRVRFGDVVHNVHETERDLGEAGIERFIGLEHLVPKDLHIRSWGNVADGTTFTRRCRPGQVLFGKRRAYQRKVAVAEFDAVVSGDIYVMAPKDKQLLAELLPFICMADRFFEHAVGTSAGSLSPRTNWKSLATFEFDLPPLDQQRRIAEILWAIDESVVKWGEVAERVKMAKMAYSIGVFGVSIDSKADNTKIWNLGDLFQVRTGGTPSRKNSQYWNGSIPWVKTGEVNYSIIQKTEETITEDGSANSAAKLFQAGSVLMALYGQGPTLGRVAMLGIDAAVNQACAVISPKDGYLMPYLFHYLSSQYEAIRKHARGASQPNINAVILKRFAIPFPSVEEQSEVVSHLNSFDRMHSIISNHFKISCEILQGISNTIFC